jgi:hypothetical protein
VSGRTDNSTILKGLNQLIKAVNDLTTCICDAVGATTTGGTGSTNGGSDMTCCCNPGANFGTIPGLPPAGPSVPPPALPGVPDPVDPMVDPPPDGFTSWEQFYTNKCQVANKIIDDLIQSLHNLASLSGVVSGIADGALFLFLNTSLLAGLLIGVMALGFAAFDAAAIIIGALVVLIVATTGGLAFFEVLASDMDKDALACAIYNGKTPQEVYANVKTILDAELPGLTDITDVISSQIAKVILALLNTSITNMPFEYHPELVGYISPHPTDCTGCTPTSEETCFEFETDLQDWTPTIGNGGAFVFSVTGSIEWSSEGGGTMKLIKADGGDSNQAGAQSPDLAYVIQDGDQLCLDRFDAFPSTEANYLEIKIDGTWISIEALTGATVGIATTDLSGYAGQTLEAIALGNASLTADSWVEVAKVGVCASC